jgi:hypothetical protein
VASTTVDEDIDVLCGVAVAWKPAADANFFDVVPSAIVVTEAVVSKAIESIQKNADEVQSAINAIAPPCVVAVVQQQAAPVAVVAQAYNPEMMFF